MTDSVGKALELKELEIGAEQAPSGSDNDLVRDFIAGMTDDYFLSQCRKHLIPQVLPAGF